MNNIRPLRKRMEMNQKELAERVLVDRATVSNWERGATRPCRKYIPIIANALEVTVEELGLEGKKL